MTTSQKNLLTQLQSGKELIQVNYKNVTKIHFTDNLDDAVNIKTIQALRKMGHTITWTIKN